MQPSWCTHLQIFSDLFERHDMIFVVGSTWLIISPGWRQISQTNSSSAVSWRQLSRQLSSVSTDRQLRRQLIFGPVILFMCKNVISVRLYASFCYLIMNTRRSKFSSRSVHISDKAHRSGIIWQPVFKRNSIPVLRNSENKYV